MKLTMRAVLATAFLLGFYVVAAGGVALLAYAAVRLTHDGGPGPAAAVTVGLLGVALLVALGISHALRRPMPDPVGLLLEEANHPDLWAEVRDLAREVGARAPDEVRLVPEPAVHVTEDVGRLGLVAGTRRLGIGVPLLLTLTRSELRALLVQQLGHYRAGLLGTSAIAYRGESTLVDLAARERGSRPLGALLRLCARAYVAVAGPVNRAQEVDADLAAARVAGLEPAMDALRRAGVVEGVWARYVTEHAFAAPGLRPLRLFEGFADLWADEEVQAGLAAGGAAGGVPVDPGAGPGERPTARTAGERLALLESVAAQRPAGQLDPAVDDSSATLVIKRSGWHAIELETSMFRWSDLRPAGWDEIAAGAALRHLTTVAATAPERLDLCVSDLTPGRARWMTRELLPADATDEQVGRTAVELVTAAVEAGLLAAGEVRAVPSWTTTWRLVDTTGRSVDVEETVASAYADPALAAALLTFVRQEGLADYRAEPPAAWTGDPQQLLGVIGVRRRGVAVLVAVTDGGVLLTPAPDPAGTGEAPTGKALQAASTRGLAALLATPGAQLVRWGDLLEVRSTPREGVLVLRLVSGEKITVPTPRGRVLGDPRQGLATHLGQRYVVPGGRPGSLLTTSPTRQPG